MTRAIPPSQLPLAGGGYFDFNDPAASSYTISDVAHALSNLCRFGGHCRFYSVAQHSVHVAEVLADQKCDRATLYAGLMHDAPEFVVGDVVKPLKVFLRDYVMFERRVTADLARRFGLPAALPPEVKEADLLMLATEQRELFSNEDEWLYTHGRRPLDMLLPVWPPDEAERAFLEKYEELRP